MKPRPPQERKITITPREEAKALSFPALLSNYRNYCNIAEDEQYTKTARAKAESLTHPLAHEITRRALEAAGYIFTGGKLQKPQG